MQAVIDLANSMASSRVFRITALCEPTAGSATTTVWSGSGGRKG
jgi:hypothetical protein